MSFIGRQYNRLLVTAVMTAFVYWCITMFDSIVAGRVLSVEALASLTIVLPVRASTDLIAALLYGGALTMFTQACGRFDQHQANRIFSMTLIAGIAAALIAMVCVFFFRYAFLDCMHAEGEVRHQAATFLIWYLPEFLMIVCADIIRRFTYASGGARDYFISMVMYAVGRIGTVILLLPKLGIGAIAAGTWCGYIPVVSYLVWNIWRRKYPLAFTPCFEFKTVWRSVTLSVGSIGSLLSLLVCSFVIARFAASRFGIAGLTVLAAVSVLSYCGLIFDSFSLSMRPLIGVYFGEQNYASVRRVFRRTMRWSAGFGAAAGIAVCICPSLITSMLGLKGVSCESAVETALRITAACQVVVACGSLWNDYFQMIGKAGRSALFMVLRTGVCPVVVTIVAASIWGLPGLGTAAVGSSLCVIGFWLWMRTTGDRSLVLLPDDKRRVFNLETVAGVLTAASMGKRVRDLAREAGIEEGKIMKLGLMAEEVLLSVYQNNPGKAVCVELTLDLRESGELIVRDDGMMIDFGNTDGPLFSLSRYVVSRMTTDAQRHISMETVGFNRLVVGF